MQGRAIAETDELTPWGKWLKTQGVGALTRAMRKTDLSWSTVSKAQRRLVTLEVAQVLASYAKGAFKAAEMTRPRKRPQ